MADTAIAITAGSGTNVDTRTESTNGNHRQVVVIGDPATNAGVAPVDATNGLAVDVKALPASTNTIEVVGDAAENAAVAGNPVLVGGRYDSSDRTLGDGDVGAIAVMANGVAKVAIHNSSGTVVDPDTTSIKGPGVITAVDSLLSAVVDLAAGTNDQSIVAAPGANKQIWVYGLVMKTNGTTATVVIEDSTPTAKTGTITLTDSDGFVLNPCGNFEMPWIKCATNTALRADTGGSGTVDGIVTYAVVDVS